jgi:hypothetical protein
MNPPAGMTARERKIWLQGFHAGRGSGLAAVLTDVEARAGERFWSISKGRESPDEPLFAIAIFDPTETQEPEIIEEGEDLEEVAGRVAGMLIRKEVIQ